MLHPGTTKLGLASVHFWILFSSIPSSFLPSPCSAIFYDSRNTMFWHTLASQINLQSKLVHTEEQETKVSDWEPAVSYMEELESKRAPCQSRCSVQQLQCQCTAFTVSIQQWLLPVCLPQPLPKTSGRRQDVWLTLSAVMIQVCSAIRSMLSENGKHCKCWWELHSALSFQKCREIILEYKYHLLLTWGVDSVTNLESIAILLLDT